MAALAAFGVVRLIAAMMLAKTITTDEPAPHTRAWRLPGSVNGGADT